MGSIRSVYRSSAGSQCVQRPGSGVAFDHRSRALASVSVSDPAGHQAFRTSRTGQALTAAKSLAFSVTITRSAAASCTSVSSGRLWAPSCAGVVASCPAAPSRSDTWVAASSRSETSRQQALPLAGEVLGLRERPIVRVYSRLDLFSMGGGVVEGDHHLPLVNGELLSERGHAL